MGLISNFTSTLVQGRSLAILLLALGGAGPVMAAETVTGSTSSLTEPQITELVMTADDAEIAQAKLAEKKGTAKDVKEFAAFMVKEHKMNEKDEQSISKETGVKPDKNTAEAGELKKQADAKTADLKKLSGAAFDRAYIDNQVNMHQQVLNDLTEKFIPAAKTPQLKTFLEQTRDHVQEHLARAKTIQASLTK